MKPELILFDLDDTLMAYDIVSNEAWDKATDQFIQENGIKTEKAILLEKILEEKEKYRNDPERFRIGRQNIYNSRREIVKLALKDFLNIEDNKLERFADNHTKIFESLWRLFDDSIETLEKIKKLNLKMGIVSNGTSENQRGKLKRFDIEKYFDYFYIEGELGYGKPDIRVYEKMLQETKIDSKKIIMVGDHLEWDIEAPQKLGIYSIWMNPGRLNIEDLQIKPDRTIYKISDILKIIET